MRAFRLFCIAFVCFVLISCKNKNPNIDKNELVYELSKEESTKKEISEAVMPEYSNEEDTIVTDIRVVGITPVLKSTKTYFLENNKYSDWDENDPKQAMIGYVVEKNGKASNVKIVRSTGNDELDKEAIRLIEEADFTVGTDVNGQYIRTGKMAIPVYFPPQK